MSGVALRGAPYRSFKPIAVYDGKRLALYSRLLSERRRRSLPRALRSSGDLLLHFPRGVLLVDDVVTFECSFLHALIIMSFAQPERFHGHAGPFSRLPLQKRRAPFQGTSLSMLRVGLTSILPPLLLSLALPLVALVALAFTMRECD